MSQPCKVLVYCGYHLYTFSILTRALKRDKFQLEAEVQEDLGDFIMTLHSTSRNAYSA